MSVAAAMIARDEESFLPGCLQSLAGIVDEVVIVDTGSRDATASIAIAAGARVLPHDWQDDFSAARNAALDAVTCDWVLYIDADERLVLPGLGRLEAYLDPLSIAASVRFRPKTGYTRYREMRLFRSHPDIRFAGRIHESVSPAIAALARRSGAGISASNVHIDHLGYDGDQAHKHIRNLPLLKASVISDPDRVYYWYHLAETLLAIDDQTGAEQAAWQGLAAAKRAPTDKQAADASLIYQILARQGLQRGEDVLELVEEGLGLMPHDFALRFLKGQALYKANQQEAALAIALSLTQADVNSIDDGLLAFDERIFAEKACELAALACFAMGDMNGAGAYFSQAAMCNPSDLSYRARAAAFSNGAASGAAA